MRLAVWDAPKGALHAMVNTGLRGLTLYIGVCLRAPCRLCPPSHSLGVSFLPPFRVVELAKS